jgi:hypothetical protein
VANHIFTCLWITLTKIDPNQHTWINSNNFEFEDSGTIYIASWYFIVTTFTTVGFGDIRAYNTMERLFCIVAMICGVAAFTLATGHLSSIMTSIERTQARLKDKKDVLDRIRKNYGLSD